MTFRRTIPMFAALAVGSALLLGALPAQAQDTSAPSFSSAAISGATLTVTFNEDLDPNSVPSGIWFTATVGGVGRSGNADSTTINGTKVQVTLNVAATHGQTATLTYSAPPTDPLQDQSGNDVADLPLQAGDQQTRRRPSPARR